ncbi:DHH family phosphoesterase [Candidatus Saccharibacteria bacterium]|nr:DHH family phosphoesterase [Candidatus Saccharibacteria bacterium]MBR3253499.1 DHH family phosphoesterase [Candidatus Saccharibacteria bacterium]
MYNKFSDFLDGKEKICVIQAENPDGDSLGSAIALDYLLSDKEVSLYCPVDIPKYLRYFSDWSRVTNEFDFKADGYIIVDTAAEVLLSKLLDDTAIRNRLYSTPVLVIDHHETEDDLEFPHESIIEVRCATAELIYRIAKELRLEISKESAEAIFQGILSDTLGLTSSSMSDETFEIAAELTRLGADVSALDERRREYMKKSPRILDYKADLIKRIEYSLDGTLATVHIPWDDIREYSDEYNPNVLILEEMRLVEGVKVAVAVKTYPDGKVTGKIRCSSDAPIAERVAGYFGGGGHKMAAGFRTYDTTYEEVVKELVKIVPELIENAG